MPVPTGEFTVGRDEDAYVHVDDGSVSRRHARIFNQEDGFFVEDLGSVNGTAAGGAFITSRMKINFGDVVHIGSVPFRVDPEVAGETEAAPLAEVRTARRDTMRRDTERIPNIGEAPRVVETLSPEKLSAPEVSQVTDMDAEAINAITMREPEAPELMRLPTIRPGLIPLPPPPGNSPRSTISVLAPQNLLPPRPHPEQDSHRQVPAPQYVAIKPPVTQPESALPERATPNTPAPGRKWGWQMIIFLAGMGTGLLLGLIFAKLFIDLGGKAASLP